MEFCAGAFEEANVVLAEGEELETGIGGEEGKNWFEVVAIVEPGDFLGRERQTIIAERVGRGKEGEALVLMFPEVAIVQKLAARSEESFGFGAGDGGGGEETFSLANHDLEATRVFVACRACAVHEDETGEAGKFV
jgi:hypothetical protein